MARLQPLERSMIVTPRVPDGNSAHWAGEIGPHFFQHGA
jgi:hypothetical protein